MPATHGADMDKEQPRDPFADYVEWTEHRYDPGHYLGGNLPPHLRSGSLGPRARRRAGVLIGITAFVMFGGGLTTLAGGVSGTSVLSLALVLMVLAAGVKMYRSGGSARARRSR